jgi:hypothetical protein
MRFPALAATLSLASVCVASAQSHRGSGISGAGIGGVVSVEYVREHWGPPDSVRLGAAILWRGQSDWAVSHGPVESERSRTAMDSARRAATTRAVQAGGTITVAANAWVEYDEHARTVSVLNHSYSLPAGDSALVLLVDRVDHVGGEPIVVPLVLPCAADADPTYASPPDGGRDIMASMRDWAAHWRGCLLREPAVRAFTGTGPTR